MDGLVIPVTVMTPQRYEWIHSYMRRMDEDIMSLSTHQPQFILSGYTIIWSRLTNDGLKRKSLDLG